MCFCLLSTALHLAPAAARLLQPPHTHPFACTLPPSPPLSLTPHPARRHRERPRHRGAPPVHPRGVHDRAGPLPGSPVLPLRGLRVCPAHHGGQRHPRPRPRRRCGALVAGRQAGWQAGRRCACCMCVLSMGCAGAPPWLRSARLPRRARAPPGDLQPPAHLRTYHPPPPADIDDYVFEPCGYSMNGVDGGTFSTVHITPEEGFSYASFELCGYAPGDVNAGGCCWQGVCGAGGVGCWGGGGAGCWLLGAGRWRACWQQRRQLRQFPPGLLPIGRSPSADPSPPLLPPLPLPLPSPCSRAGGARV